MAWGTKTSATTLTNISNTEQFFDQTPQLNPRELAHCEIDVDFVGSPTDDMLVSVYGSLDGTNYDDSPLVSFVIDKDTDPHQVSFTVVGVWQFRVGVQATGGTDTHTSADFAFRKDGVNV